MPRRRHAIRRARHFAFAVWALALGRLPRVEEVEGYFGVTRRRALEIHREWVNALRTQPPATTKPGGNRHHQETCNDP